MQIKIYQVILILVLASLFISGFLIARYILNLPFRPANDELHNRESPVTLDFLIPGGAYLDEKITIGEVIQIRINKETPRYKKVAEVVSDLIPVKYRYLADLLLFLFWSLLFVTFLRVFTFISYSRALRGSLFLGGTTYYFMPDFSLGKADDFVFMGLPLTVIFLRIYTRRRKKKSRNPNSLKVPDKVSGKEDTGDDGGVEKITTVKR